MGPKKFGANQASRANQSEGATGGEDDSGADPELAAVAEDLSMQELRDMFRALMARQEAREDQLEQEAVRQEGRWKSIQHQFNLLQREVHARTTPEPDPVVAMPARGASAELAAPSLSAMPSRPASVAPPRPNNQGRTVLEREPKLQCLGEHDDIEHFLVTFERVAVACQWPIVDWAVRLAPLLTGKARAAYVAMDSAEALDYEKLKDAIMAKFNINRETYRVSFRTTEGKGEESPRELYVRLRDLYHRWVQPQKRTKEEIGEMIIMEQFFRLLSPDLQVWIKERDPKSASEAASLADVFVAARRKNEPWTYAQWRVSKDPGRPRHQLLPPKNRALVKADISTSTSVGGKSGPPKFTSAFKFSRPSRPSSPRVPVCFHCGEEGHIKPKYPNNPANQSNICTVPRASAPSKSVALSFHTVILNGREVDALADTGSMQSLVRADVVPVHLHDYSVTTNLKCVHGDEKAYPTASVHVKVSGQVFLLEVGVVDNLPYPMILGQDFPLLCQLVAGVSECNVAVTRAMAKSREEEAPLSALPFFNADIEARPGKSRKSKRQRRREKLQFGGVREQEEPRLDSADVPVEIPQGMALMQQQDLDIGLLYRQSQCNVDAGGMSGQDFVIKDGVLHKSEGAGSRMVVPLKARKIVLELGHSIPWAGHLGKHKTVARIIRYFYWPNMAKDIAEFCRTCPECQKTANRFPSKVPLEPLPVVGTPFEQLGMDVREALAIKWAIEELRFYLTGRGGVPKTLMEWSTWPLGGAGTS
ncbi:hypothetical protein MHYP_G00004850 [Metynnis hypsauchen]